MESLLFNPPRLSQLDESRSSLSSGTALIHLSDDGITISYCADPTGEHGLDEVVYQHDDSIMIPAEIVLDPDTGEIHVGIYTRDTPVYAKRISGLLSLLGCTYAELKCKPHLAHINALQDINGELQLNLGSTVLTPTQWLGLLIEQARRLAEVHLLKHVSTFVMTHPESLGIRGRSELHRAAAYGGIKRVRLVRYTAAAAMGFARTYVSNLPESRLWHALDRKPPSDSEFQSIELIISYIGYEGAEIARAIVDSECSDTVVEILECEASTSCGIAAMERGIAAYLKQLSAISGQLRVIRADWHELIVEARQLNRRFIDEPSLMEQFIEVDGIKHPFSRAEWLAILKPFVDEIKAIWQRLSESKPLMASFFEGSGDDLKYVLPLGATDLIDSLSAVGIQQFQAAYCHGRALTDDSDVFIIRGGAAQAGVLGGVLKRFLLIDSIQANLIAIVRLQTMDTGHERCFSLKLTEGYESVPHKRTVPIFDGESGDFDVQVDIIERQGTGQHILTRLGLGRVTAKEEEPEILVLEMSIGADFSISIDLIEAATGRRASARLPWPIKKVGQTLDGIDINTFEYECLVEAPDPVPTSAIQLESEDVESQILTQDEIDALLAAVSEGDLEGHEFDDTDDEPDP